MVQMGTAYILIPHTCTPAPRIVHNYILGTAYSRVHMCRNLHESCTNSGIKVDAYNTFRAYDTVRALPFS
jgi:hypothetical protein